MNGFALIEIVLAVVIAFPCGWLAMSKMARRQNFR